MREIPDFLKYSSEDRIIIDAVKQALDKMEYKFSCDPKRHHYVALDFSIENKPLSMIIFVKNGKIAFRLSYPFRCQANCIPFIALYIARYNADKSFSKLNLNENTGEITMEYSYFLGMADRFLEEAFYIYLHSVLLPATEEYTKLSTLCVGKLSTREENLYRTLIEDALKTVSGQFFEENVEYGLEKAKIRLMPDLKEPDDGFWITPEDREHIEELIKWRHEKSNIEKED